MRSLEFFCVNGLNEPSDIKPEIRDEEVESYYNISWVNNKRHINVAFQEIKAIEATYTMHSNLTEEDLNVLRNFWQDTVLKLRLKSIPQWPVQQRKEPFIATVELYMKATFDNVRDYFFGNIIHWGSNNYLAVCLNQVVRIIPFDNFREKKSFPHEYEIKLNNNKTCSGLLWNRKATCIAISTKVKEIEVWNPKQNKCTYSYRCKCKIKTCTIDSMEWSNSDNLISGCSNGYLCFYNKNLPEINFEKIHDGSITNIKFSSQDRYLATCSIDSTVKIWTMPEFDLHHRFTCFKPTKAIAWHPWTEHHFVIGGFAKNNVLTLWNPKEVDQFQQLDSVPNCGDDIFTARDLTFNPTSGELVVNYTVLPGHSNTISKCRSLIFVYSNLLSMVDIIHWHQFSVLHLMWNNDGTKLFTLDVSGKGAVWDFLGDRDKTFIKSKSFLEIEYGDIPRY